MCGIAGIIQDHSDDSRVDIVEQMLTRIAHRGPDESGIYHSRRATIGNVRLSIIDIAGGQQPIPDSSGRYWIVFNGEIFNYIELRKDLEKLGCNFTTKSDTEVLVYMYARYGKDMVSKLNGQFAFAVWDNLEKELFMARDRLGIRPLFYYQSDTNFAFASEIKSLLEWPEIRTGFSPLALAQNFTFWTTLTPNTVFENIYELPPGHILTLKNNKLETRKYWELPFDRNNPYSSIEEAAEDFRDIFSSATNFRLRADVEVGAYLSGGLDSSITVSAIKNLQPQILNTFSIGFAEKEFNESDYQDTAAAFFDTRHRSVNIGAEKIAAAFPDVVYFSETPLLRTAPVPMYLLSKLVSENNIKVVVTGEGADEFFGGYNIFKEMMIRRFWAAQPDSKLRPLLLKRLYPYLPHIQNASPAMLKMFFNFRLEDTSNPYYSHLIRWNNTGHILKLTSPGFSERITKFKRNNEINRLLPADFDRFDPLSKAQWLESTIFMSGYLLSSQGDRMAMGNSIEGRYPFLDHNVIEFASKLPADWKMNGLNEKYFLKRAFAGIVPDSVLQRSKQAYRAPIHSVFMGANAPDYVQAMLSRELTIKAGVFDPAKVERLQRKMMDSNHPNELDNMMLTAVISTHLLHDMFMGGNKPEIPRLTNLQTFIDI